MQKEFPKVITREETADWLAELLALTREANAGESNERYLLRAREAADQAWAINQLRQKRGQYGFMPVPLPEYLAQLAQLADVPAILLSSLLPSLDKRDLDQGWVKGAARLMQRLNFDIAEALAFLRLTFGTHMGLEPTLLMRLRARSGGSNPDDINDILRAQENQYDSGTVRRLRGLERALRDAYQEQEHHDQPSS